MKNSQWLFTATLLWGCASHMPIATTGNPNEFVVMREDWGLSLSVAKQEAQKDATEHCKKMGKNFAEKYSLDRLWRPGQIPETTLYFTCVDPK